MFTCAKIKASKGKGADFYRQHLSCNDYFSEHESIDGTWRGSLASAFHLDDKVVDPRTFSEFQQNVNPATKGKLTPRNVRDAVRFYDFQCSAQKSVSIMALFDDRLAEAHRKAVQTGMREMERFAAVRLRAGEHANTYNLDFTGNFLYAEYHHDSSRLLDPQLHTHNVIVNLTRDKDGSFKALQNREMLRAIRYANKVYLNELARSCISLGYEITPKFHKQGEIVGFEIKGVSDELIERCSKRRAQIDKAIEKFAEIHGRQPSADEVNELTLLTRSRKMLERSNSQVTDYKLSLFTEEEKSELRRMRDYAMDTGAMFLPGVDEKIAANQLGKVAEQLFERESVVSWDKLMAEALNQNLGKTDLRELKAAIGKLPQVINMEAPAVNPYFTTDDHLNRERYILETVEKMKGVKSDLASDYVPFSEVEDTFDHTEQKKVVESIVSSPDPFMIFRGVAGAGKTSTLQELCKCLKKGGVGNIHVIAPTNSAVDVLRTEGFGSAQTVAKFLQDSRTLPPRGSYLIVDESGLNSIKQGYEMMRAAMKNDYRVLFVGDERQHSSVEAGDFFRLLEQHSAIRRTALTEIHRQQPELYRRGVELAASGALGDSFDHLDGNGFIHENKGKYLDEAAASFLRLTENGERPLDCIAVSPTHREGELLTDKIRKLLKENGKIDAESEREVDTFHSWNWMKERIGDAANYRVGMRIFMTTKVKELGVPGVMLEVASVQGERLTLTNGQSFYPSQFKDRIDVGESRKLPLAKGDIVRLSVNLRTPEYKINNGSLAIATGNPNEFTLLDHNRRELTTVQLPPNFCGFRHGWVITSHSSQGQTCKNVVVAAEKMSGQAFYVACSRGKQNLALHIPDREFFRDRLLKIPTERLSVTDLTSQGIGVPRKAPVCPPTAEMVAGSYVKHLIKRAMREMRKVYRQVGDFVEKRIYNLFAIKLERNRNHVRTEPESPAGRPVVPVPVPEPVREPELVVKPEPEVSAAPVPERTDRIVETPPRIRRKIDRGIDL